MDSGRHGSCAIGVDIGNGSSSLTEQDRFATALLPRSRERSPEPQEIRKHVCRLGFNQAGRNRGLESFSLTSGSITEGSDPAAAMDQWISKEEAGDIDIFVAPEIQTRVAWMRNQEYADAPGSSSPSFDPQRILSPRGASTSAQGLCISLLRTEIDKVRQSYVNLFAWRRWMGPDESGNTLCI
jgi:hypothetical protein